MALTTTHGNLPVFTNFLQGPIRVGGDGEDIHNFIHTDAVYNALLNAAYQLEDRLKDSLKNYQEHPDVQANLQQLQYEVMNLSFQQEGVTKVADKSSNAIQTLVKNQ